MAFQGPAQPGCSNFHDPPIGHGLEPIVGEEVDRLIVNHVQIVPNNSKPPQKGRVSRGCKFRKKNKFLKYIP